MSRVAKHCERASEKERKREEKRRTHLSHKQTLGQTNQVQHYKSVEPSAHREECSMHANNATICFTEQQQQQQRQLWYRSESEKRLTGENSIFISIYPSIFHLFFSPLSQTRVDLKPPKATLKRRPIKEAERTCSAFQLKHCSELGARFAVETTFRRDHETTTTTTTTKALRELD